ncbi:tetratricopeptide repeat protein [Aliivibrio finisterrensis]|uniref:Tetratricopeptide repeat protein n=1 Tax=Aliivibrio finisterrensis TaxID=511998 RepID=A0A6N6RWD3_9GAMM|nr:tetratricopeptide repeat protein [Aliivibrio finisterrensis]KAB2825740.1 tetratricopeptide repeat protein [Aliivibrio finisterrensis]
MMKLIVSIFSVVLMFSEFAQAQQLTQYNAAKVQRAIQLQQQDKIVQAIDVLADLLPSQPYDKAYVQRMLGVFYWQNGNSKAAVKSLSIAVNSQQLVDEQAWITQRMLADLLLTEQRFAEALPHYYQLTKTVPEKQKVGDLWFRIAQTHYQLSEWKKVLSALKQHQHTGKYKERNNDRQLLVLKLGAQLQLKHWKSAIPTLNALIVLEPNQAGWWQQLSSIQLRLNQPKHALDTLILAERQGIELSQSELKLLAQLYAQRGIPEKAAQVMATLAEYETDKEAIVTQATYWQAAKEWDKAITAWKKAAKFDDQYYWQVAQLKIQEGHYQQGLKSLDKVKDYNKTDDVALAKTRAYYKLNQLELALVNAKRANDFTPSNEAKGWIQYLSQLRKMES